MLYGLENFSRSILFDEEFESALRFFKKSKAIFSVCEVITRKVYSKVMDLLSCDYRRKFKQGDYPCIDNGLWFSMYECDNIEVDSNSDNSTCGTYPSDSECEADE